MTNYLQLINGLQPIDVVVAKKRNGIGSILDHYIVYLGNGVFIGNLKGSVKQVSHFELIKLLEEYEPVKVRRFNGTQYQIEQAIVRVKQRLGHRYSFLGFNCEHFANWVQYGQETSTQVRNGFLLVAGLITVKLIASNNGER